MTAPSYEIHNFAYSILILVGTYVVMRILRIKVWLPYESRHGKPIPQILISLVNISLSMLSLSIIMVGIFEKSLLSLMTAGGIVGAGIALSLQSPLLDFFSGLMIDLEGRAENGNWVKLNSDATGQIIGHNWRSVTLLTLDNTVIVIPNSNFLKDQYENISYKGSFWETVEVPLDYDIPVLRAERIITAAIRSLPNIYQQSVAMRAHQLTEGGIVYRCRYKISNYKDRTFIRHEVIKKITETLHAYKLGVSETIGEYIISLRSDLPPPWVHQETKEIVGLSLQKTPLIKELGAASLTLLERSCLIKVFKEKDVIFKQGDQGDSMYIILEGSVDIHINHDESSLCVASLGPFDYFGEISLFLGEKRSASVFAATSLVVAEITRELIHPLLNNNKELLEKLSQSITSHITENNNKIQSLEEMKDKKNKSLINRVKEKLSFLFFKQHPE